MCVVSQMYILTKIHIMKADIRAKTYFRHRVKYHELPIATKLTVCGRRKRNVRDVNHLESLFAGNRYTGGNVHCSSYKVP
jgi:hypothetical protein